MSKDLKATESAGGQPSHFDDLMVELRSAAQRYAAEVHTCPKCGAPLTAEDDPREADKE